MCTFCTKRCTAYILFVEGNGREDEYYDISETDVIILTGGHVPTQNAFFNKIGLKEKLKGYRILDGKMELICKDGENLILNKI